MLLEIAAGPQACSQRVLSRAAMQNEDKVALITGVPRGACEACARASHRSRAGASGLGRNAREIASPRTARTPGAHTVEASSGRLDEEVRR